VIVSGFAALIARGAPSQPWGVENVIVSVVLALFCAISLAWLTKKVGSSKIRTLIERKRVRQKLANSLKVLSAALPKQLAEAMLVDVSISELCRHHSQVTIGFINICEYDKLVNDFANDPEALVRAQDCIWTSIDALLEYFPAVQKVETIGSTYLIVVGAPTAQPRHAEIAAHFALCVYELCKNICGCEVSVSVGVSVLAGGRVVLGGNECERSCTAEKRLTGLLGAPVRFTACTARRSTSLRG
jgi:hypothetical protein